MRIDNLFNVEVILKEIGKRIWGNKCGANSECSTPMVRGTEKR